MTCTKCGANLDNDAIFCPICGTKQEAVQPVFIQPEQNLTQPVYSQPEQDLTQPVYSQPEQDLTQPVYSQPEQNLTQPMYSQQGQDINEQAYRQPDANMNQVPPVMMQPEQKKPVSKKLLFGGIGAAAVLVIAIVLIFVLNGGSKTLWSGTIAAIAKNIESGGFVMKVRMDDDSMTVTTSIDPKESQLAFIAKESESSYKYAMYKGILMRVKSSSDIREDEDFSDELKTAFKYYNKYIAGINGIADIDYKGLMKDISSEIDDSYTESMLEALEEEVDFEKLKEAVAKFEANMNDEEYLEEHFNYSKETDGNVIIHSLKFDMEDLAELLIDEFESASDMVDTIPTDGLDRYSLKVDITIEGGYLTELKLTASDTEYDDKETLRFTFSDFGGETIKDMLETVQEYYKDMD